MRNKRSAFSSEMSEEQASAKEGKCGYHGARIETRVIMMRMRSQRS